jgi:hypothetical protein
MVQLVEQEHLTILMEQHHLMQAVELDLEEVHLVVELLVELEVVDHLVVVMKMVMLEEQTLVVEVVDLEL